MAAPAQSLGYGVFDADNHYYEPLDVFGPYIEPEYADRTFHTVEDDGQLTVIFDGRVYGHVSGEGRRQRIRPGSLRAELRGAAEANQDPDADDSYASDPAARLNLMDQQGIEAALVFPGFGVTIENLMRYDTGLLLAHVRAFNRWLLDTWGFVHHDRIVSPPLISLADPDQAVRDVEHAIENGARAVDLLAGPGKWGVSPADPVYDPFWARINEAGTLVTYHLGNSGYMERYSADWGENPDPDGIAGGADSGIFGTTHQTPDMKGKGRSAFQWTMLYMDRPIMDTIAILIYHNLFGRFPEVQVASVENDARWVPYLIKSMDLMKGMARNGPWPGGYPSGRPSEIFRQHVYVEPNHTTDDVASLVELIGADRVIFGSDFPHPEGMSDVYDYKHMAARFAGRLGLPDDATRKVMRENGLRAVGLVT